MKKPEILASKYYQEETVFRPENLLREARRQKNLNSCDVPKTCLLDPDGDVVRYLKEIGQAQKNDCWACYHSEMYNVDLGDHTVGIIPCAVGSSYAVLVAEQLFASGCKTLISVTSAGVITDKPLERRFGLITESIRDEGTSYHYLPPERESCLNPELYNMLKPADESPYFDIKSWTTDAPYRETPSAIEDRKSHGITSVEMEAAALYAFAEYAEKEIICFAHLTNTMAQEEGDFEKGEHFGSKITLELVEYVLGRLEQVNEQ